MLPYIGNMATWVTENADRVVSYLVYKKDVSPYEQNRQCADESIYEEDTYLNARIKEAIDLGNGDWLLGLRPVIEDYDPDVDDTDEWGYTEYYRLSEIHLALFDRMNEEDRDES